MHGKDLQRQGKIFRVIFNGKNIIAFKHEGGEKVRVEDHDHLQWLADEGGDARHSQHETQGLVAKNSQQLNQKVVQSTSERSANGQSGSSSTSSHFS